MERMQWIDRKFQFDVPPGWLPNVLVRLAGTGSRLHNLVAGLSDGQLGYKPEGKWSIKEHIGHLSDLEKVHEGRLQDFRDRKDVLRPADMQNIATEEANHNSTAIDTLIDALEKRRFAFMDALINMDDVTHAFVAMHPRLRIPMKPVDMATFTAEHDDHHLATIGEIRRKFSL